MPESNHEISFDIESFFEFSDESLDKEENQLNDNVENGFLDPEAVEINRQASEAVLRDVQASLHTYQLYSPSAADGASRYFRRQLEGGKVVEQENVAMGIDLTEAGASPVLSAFVRTVWQAEEARAHPLLIPPEAPVPPQPEPVPPQPEPDSNNRRAKYIVGGACFGVVILSVILLSFQKQIFPSSRVPQLAGGNDLVPDKILDAQQNYLSLMMQAAADNPVNYADFGISQETYGLMRQAILMTRDNIPEESHWQMQADQSKLIYPPTQKPLTLGDHLISLDFLTKMLMPLYPVQPFDLDIDQAISTLAGLLDLEAETPMTTLYQSVMDIAPESSGISRLQRIVLLRRAIVRAFSQSIVV